MRVDAERTTHPLRLVSGEEDKGTIASLDTGKPPVRQLDTTTSNYFDLLLTMEDERRRGEERRGEERRGEERDCYREILFCT